MRRAEDHTVRKVFRTDIPGKRKRGNRETEEGTTENKVETCNSTILRNVGLLD